MKQQSTLEALIKVAESCPDINIYYILKNKSNISSSQELPTNLYLEEEVDIESFATKNVREIFKISALQNRYGLIFSTLWLSRSATHYRVLKNFTNSEKNFAFIIEDKANIRDHFIKNFKQIALSLPQDKEIVLTQGSDFSPIQTNTEIMQNPCYQQVDKDFKTISLSSYFISKKLAKRITRFKRIKALINDLTYFTSLDKVVRIQSEGYLTDSSEYFIEEVGQVLDKSPDRSPSIHFLTYRYALMGRTQKVKYYLQKARYLLCFKLFQKLR